MVTRRRKRSKKWIFRLFLLILIIVAIVIVYLVWDSYFNDKKKEVAPEDKEVPAVQVEPEPKAEEKTPEKVEEKEDVKQYDGNNPNTDNSLSGAVTYAGVNNDKLMIRVNINQYLSGGSCTLRLLFESDVNMYEEMTEIIDSASTSTCAGFDVPLSRLSKGHYLIIINMNSDGKTGTINGEVDV